MSTGDSLRANELKLLKHMFYGYIYHSPANSCSSGVLLRISKVTKCILQQEIEQYPKLGITIVGVYAANHQQQTLGDKIYVGLMKYSPQHIFALGDYNTDKRLDRSKKMTT